MAKAVHVQSSHFKIQKFMCESILFMAVLTSFTILSSPKAQAGVTVTPCTCVWDGSTKEYPRDGKTKGWWKTTVKYQCGYICKDRDGQPFHIVADHQASYRVERGDEVVCDGLRYEGHDNPTGDFDRWVIYMWDGQIRPFAMNRSTSTNLKQLDPTCTASPQTGKGGISSAELNDLLLQVGQPPL